MKEQNYSPTQLLKMLEIAVFIAIQFHLVTSSSLVKSFRKISFPQTGRLCAIDSPSAILTVFELQDEMQWKQPSIPTLNIPFEVLCADRCTLEPKCMGFVFKFDVQQCQLYFYPPVACTIQQQCSYFAVSKITVQACCESSPLKLCLRLLSSPVYYMKIFYYLKYKLL
jgi:hypothetical protein